MTDHVQAIWDDWRQVAEVERLGGKLELYPCTRQAIEDINFLVVRIKYLEERLNTERTERTEKKEKELDSRLRGNDLICERALPAEKEKSCHREK